MFAKVFIRRLFCFLFCFGERGSVRRGGGLCSVSIDRLDYDCLASSVDICVSSLTSASRPSLLRCLWCLSLRATGLRAGPHIVDVNPADTLVPHSKLLNYRWKNLFLQPWLEMVLNLHNCVVAKSWWCKCSRYDGRTFGSCIVLQTNWILLKCYL